MARTRAQRRRYQVLVSLALVVTVLVLAFANDVTHAAHQARSPRRSENRTFGVLANRLITEENADDARLVYLLEHGSTLSRSVLLARLLQIAQQLPSWATDARLLRRPSIAHGLNSTIADLTTQRVNDDATILDTLAQALHLPWTPIATVAQSWVSAQQSLAQSTAAWSVARWGLVHEPGLVHLDALSDALATVPFRTAVTTLSSSPSLVLTRGIGITAVAVTPAPLPAPAGQLVLAPVTSVHLAVTVTNAAVDTQPVSLTVTVTPTDTLGTAQHQVMTATLDSLGSYGFVLHDLTTVASEHFTLRIVAGGAPSGRGWPTTRIYQVTMAPSGAGG